ncbi:MAG: hypothetical protein ABL857_09490 [Rickettsiales bacterium]|jgi:hypothetical protein
MDNEDKNYAKLVKLLGKESADALIASEKKDIIGNEFFGMIRDNNIAAIRESLKKGYDPSGFIIDKFDDAPPLWRSIYPSLNLATSLARTEIVELVIDRLKEVHANAPLKLAEELISGYAKPRFLENIFRDKNAKQAISNCNDKIDHALQEILPKLEKHTRSVIEDRMKYATHERYKRGV